MQTIKMTWMLFWRVSLFMLFVLQTIEPFTAFMFSLVAAFVIRFGFKRTIRIFPIFNLIRGRNPFVPVNYGTVPGPRNHSYGLSRYESLPKISKASGPSKLPDTGYEPRYLDAVPVPSVNSVRNMRGVPGSGLSSSGFGQGSIQAGQVGETNFAKALSITSRGGAIDHNHPNRGIIQNMHSFWSVAMPSAEDASKRDKEFDTDIDCILISGKNMILVDTKNYASGDVTYVADGNQLFCLDNPTGSVIGKTKTMSRNMAMAQERFSSLYPDMNVTSMVVFMPTNLGSPIVQNVFWPEGIPAMDIQTAFKKIYQNTAVAHAQTPTQVLRNTALLVKN